MTTSFFNIIINDLEKEIAASGMVCCSHSHQGNKDKAERKILQKDFPGLTEGGQKKEVDEMQCR